VIMKLPVSLAVLAVLSIGFLIGRVTSASRMSERGLDDAAELAPGKTRVAERRANPVASTPFAQLRREIQTAQADQCGRLLYQALETADPFLRRTLVDELYARMDAGNFFEMTEALRRVSLETGRAQNDEWFLIHARSGQVAGPQAMARWKELGKLGGEVAERTLWGWATQDPDAARKWLDEQPNLTQSQRERLFSTVMAGAIIQDPNRAKSLLEGLPEADRVRSVDEFVGAFFQHQGKDRAIEWLTAVRASEPDSEFCKGMTRSVFDKTLWPAANQLNASAMVSDLERLAAIMPINEDWIKRGMGQIRDRKITGGIELIDQISRSPTLNGIPLGETVWTNAVGHALQRNPSAVADWLKQNPDSPIHSVVSSMMDQAGK
jgi:hypothetical protein